MINNQINMSESAILCVDDEAVILDSLKEQLKRQFGDRYMRTSTCGQALCLLNGALSRCLDVSMSRCGLMRFNRAPTSRRDFAPEGCCVALLTKAAHGRKDLSASDPQDRNECALLETNKTRRVLSKSLPSTCG